jgi:hypothetical protein
MADPTELPGLSPEVVADDEALGEAVDAVIRLDPVAGRRAQEVAEYQGWLRECVDAEAWKLCLEIDARQTEKWADVVVRVAAWAFEEGRRFPVLTSEAES